MSFLKTNPCDINGTSILEVCLPQELSKASDSYCLRSMKLYLIMTKLLQAVEYQGKCQGTLDQLDSQVTLNYGVSLLFATKEAILHCTSLQILDVLLDTGFCLQENGGTVEAFGTQVKHLFTHLKSLDCTTVNQLQLLTLQRGFLHGAYFNHELLN